MNTGRRQLLAEVLRTWAFDRADTEEEHLHLLIERCRVSKDAVMGGLKIESTAAAAAAAEPAEVRELVKVREHVWNDCIPPIESPAIARFSRPGATR